MPTAPAFQFYPKDFLSSGKVDRMSMTERGVYITLLSRCWLDEGLSSDLADLASIVRMKQPQFERMWNHGQLRHCFVLRADKLTNERLEDERLKQAEYRRRQSDCGKRGGRPVKGQPLPAERVAFPDPLLAAKGSQSSSSSSPISDLHTAVETPTARPQPIVARRRPDAAFEYGRLYVPNRAHQDLLALRPGGEQELLDWYEVVCEDWTNGAHRAASPGADMIRFWKLRADEKWPPDASARAVAVDRRPQWLQDADARKRARAEA
jgi:uncharacterized protein YdaU (DUF1376 family)